ncbi:MAG: MFS transporter [Candidatus Saliniplasma sp.]
MSQSKHKQKWFILLLLFITIVLAFIGRLSTSVALNEIGDELVWSHAEQGFLGGILMGIFLVSYGFSNVFFSPNIDKYGSKIVLTSSLIGCSFAVFLGAFFGHIYSLFLLSRLLIGLSQGVMFPVASKVIAGWFAVRERSRANSIFITGSSVGVAMAPIIMGPFIYAFNWRFSFYMVAALGFILAIPVMLFISDSPDGKVSSNRDIDLRSVFKTLLKDRSFQQITVGFTAVNTIWWGTTLWVPTYLEELYGLNIGAMPYVAALPYMGAIGGLLTGAYISDKKGNPDRVIMFSLALTGVMLAVVTFTPATTLISAVLLLVILFFFGQMTPPLFFTKLQNTTRSRELGSATGLMNGIANTFGVVGPVSVGVVVALTGSYPYGILSLSSIAFVGLIGFKSLL